jgi:hypothetical protein
VCGFNTPKNEVADRRPCIKRFVCVHQLPAYGVIRSGELRMRFRPLASRRESDATTILRADVRDMVGKARRTLPTDDHRNAAAHTPQNRTWQPMHLVLSAAPLELARRPPR